ncbi:radical SAM protein [Megamonas funiformis]|uniref:radical SAM protein n=1 Tax=Megamonas funiformis TaxID=437897 RepID=UPI0022E689BA|nr:radical SAM protein [Megamonas funiformis]
MKRFVDCYIPITSCNFKCHYCYIGQLNKFDNKPPEFKYSNEYIAKALSKERLGGACILNLCAGGETLLVPRIVDLIRLFLEDGHYVNVVTNGSLSARFDEIVKFPSNLLKNLFFKFSFHYFELKRLNKMEEYFNNIEKVKKAGCSFTVELTPSDEEVPYIDDIMKITKEKVGAYCHITIARKDFDPTISILSKYTLKEYKDFWGKFNSEFFDFKMQMYQQKRKEFCYAGEWSFWVNIGTGEMKQCYANYTLGNIYKNINKPLNFLPVGHNCKLPYCYNAHAYLTLGDIPELDTPTYEVLRNRICKGGKEWLTPTYKEIFSQKLVDSNRIYTKEEQKKIDRKNKYLAIKNKIERIKKKL